MTRRIVAALLGGLALSAAWVGSAAQAQDAAKKKGAPAPAKSAPVAATPKKKSDKDEPKGPPIEMKPYKIRAFVSFDLSTRVDRRLRNVVVAEWVKLAARFVGAPWELEIGDADGPAGLLVLDDLTPSAAKGFAAGVDKVWFLQGSTDGPRIVLAGREYDVATGWLGTRHEASCIMTDDLPRSLMKLTLELFAPVAEIGEQRGGGVMIRVQGAALKSPDPIGAVVNLFSVFTPVRVFLNEDGSPLEVVRVPYSYLRVASMDGLAIYCEIIRGIRDPLTRRVIRKNKMIALGVKPAAAPTRLKFVHDGTKTPAAGYVLTSRPIPAGPAREVATTDRDGRVVLPPGFAPNLVRLRLVAGKAEPMVDIPIMPGEAVEERVIPFIPRPQTITLESQIDALRDAIIDNVAVRNRLERRMKARVDSDAPDWDDVEESLKEYRTLAPRDSYVKRLKALEDDAKATEKKTKALILTRNALSQIKDTEALIDRYLDDELFNAYQDALDRARGVKKTEAAKKATASAGPAPVAPGKAAEAAKTAPAPKTKAAPKAGSGSGSVTPF